MKVSSSVYVGQASQYLFHNCHDLIVREPLSFMYTSILSEMVENSPFHIFKNKVDVILHSEHFL